MLHAVEAALHCSTSMSIIVQLDAASAADWTWSFGQLWHLDEELQAPALGASRASCSSLQPAVRLLDHHKLLPSPRVLVRMVPAGSSEAVGPWGGTQAPIVHDICEGMAAVPPTEGCRAAHQPGLPVSPQQHSCPAFAGMRGRTDQASYGPAHSGRLYRTPHGVLTRLRYIPKPPSA